MYFNDPQQLHGDIKGSVGENLVDRHILQFVESSFKSEKSENYSSKNYSF